MPNWSQSMQQTFEYYIVDPNTWSDTELLTNVTSSFIDRDLSAETLGSASIEITDSIGECYIRIYLVVIQNGIPEKIPLGTFLIQTPNSTFDGKVRSVTMDAYTPLLELKENPPPLGYTILEDENILFSAYRILREQLRAPVIKSESSDILHSNFVSNLSDRWSTFIADLLAQAKYKLGLDELGRVIFLPDQDIASLQPVYTYNDDNSSILYPDFSMSHDIYGIPNVVEVIYSSGSDYFNIRIENNDPNSPTSIQRRGREIIYRDTDPALNGRPSEIQLKEYAEQLLKDLSSIEYTVTYTHGYCPVRLGDCVRLNYSKAGINNIKAKVISQKISCKPGCPVTEKAVFTTKLWR